jgi:hypothetical protein
MPILLKELLKEIVTDVTTDSPLRVQCYVDLDGVLVDMVKGFKALSGGYTPETIRNKFGGDKKAGSKEFWKLVNGKKDFWINLDPMPDATVLWKFLTDNFKDPVPVILSAGQGSSILQQKTAWVRKHISPTVKVMLAPGGAKKSEFIIQPSSQGSNQYVTHVLIDDTQKNLDAWNNESQHRIAIHHQNAASTIQALEPFIK